MLVRIDPRDYQAKVDQAQAALAVAESQAQGASVSVPLTRETTHSSTSSAEAQLSGAQADYEQAKLDYQRASTADIAVARSNVETAQATADRAQADLNRMKTLVDKEEISRLQYDSYVAAARVARANCKRPRTSWTARLQDAETKKAALLARASSYRASTRGSSQAKANQQQVNVRTADAASAPANIAQARANLETAELNLSYTTIVAPMDGVVTKKSVEVGQIVQQGQGLLMLVPLQDVWVTANFKETQLADVRCRPKGRSEGRLERQNLSRPCRFARRRHRHAHEPAASGERDRQLRQSGSKNSREDRARSDPGRQPSAASGNEHRSYHFHQVAAEMHMPTVANRSSGLRTPGRARRSIHGSSPATVMLATFMEVLDTSVANVALPHIAGSLSSSVDEATWVLTAYLVANAIVLPLSGWFSTLFGRKRFYMTCVLLFTASSAMCGLAPSSADIDLVPRAAGLGRRRAAARFASHPARDLSARKARHGDGDVWNGRGVRARGRADAGRMDHRQLHLALDLPDQRSSRHLFVAADLAADLRSALFDPQDAARTA